MNASITHKVIISGKSNLPLAKKIAKELGLPLGKCEVKQFSDGESYVHIGEDIKGKTVYVVQSGSFPANHHLMEMLLLLQKKN